LGGVRRDLDPAVQALRIDVVAGGSAEEKPVHEWGGMILERFEVARIKRVVGAEDVDLGEMDVEPFGKNVPEHGPACDHLVAESDAWAEVVVLEAAGVVCLHRDFVCVQARDDSA
jgi:hypothetical protein